MASFTISPTHVLLSTTANAIVATGTGTSYSGATTFTVSAVNTGVSGSIASQSNVSSTVQNISYNAPASPGMVAFSDGATTSYLTIDIAGGSSIFSDNFTRANAAVGGVSNGWIDNATLFGITSNQLTSAPGTSNFNNRLLRPMSEAVQNGAVRTRFGPNWTQTSSVTGVLGRVSETTDNLGSCIGTYCIPNSTNVTNGMRIYTVAAGATSPTVIASLSNVTIPANGWIELVFSGSTITGNLYQSDGVTLITTLTSSTLTGVFLNSGTFGILAESGQQHISEFDSYATTSISVSPTTMGLNTSQVFAVTGSGTSFNGTSFTVSGLSGASITAQSASSGTAASVTIATGATGGTITLTDTLSGATATITTQAMAAPTISQTPIEIVSGNPTITFGGPALNGTAPYTYNIYRSPNCNLNTSVLTPNPSNDPSAIIVSTQTTSGTPSSYTDTSPLKPANFYIVQCIDSSSGLQTVYTNQVAAMVSSTPATVGIMACGDSIGAGHLATNFINFICSVDVTVGGTLYTNPTVTPSSGNATFGTTVVGGVLKAIYPTNQAAANTYTSETGTTYTITDSTGSGAAATTHSIGGGPSLAAKYMLQGLYNYDNIPYINTSAGGTTTQNWLPLGTNNGTNQNNTTAYWLSNAMNAAVSATAYPIWSFLLGANDCNGNITKAQYKGNYVTIINALITFGVQKIILQCPPYTSRNPIGAATLLLLQQYSAACFELAALYPGVVIAIGQDNFNLFYAHQNLLGVDVLHPDDAGYGVLGGQLMLGYGQALGLIPPNGSIIRNNNFTGGL